MTELKGGLGRGLSALLPHEVRIAGSPQLRDIAIDEIKPNARQPRTAIDDDALGELAASIRSVGLLQPVVVRPVDGGYELVAGERRWRACRLAGLTRVPAIIRETGDDQMLRDALSRTIAWADSSRGLRPSTRTRWAIYRPITISWWSACWPWEGS